MNHYEIPAMLEDEFPGIGKNFSGRQFAGNVNTAMLGLARYTRQMIGRHDWSAVTRCMRLADRIYNKGNTMVKNAVENVFVYAFSGFRSACDKAEWSLVQARIPMTLYSLYVKQIYRSGL